MPSASSPALQDFAVRDMPEEPAETTLDESAARSRLIDSPHLPRVLSIVVFVALIGLWEFGTRWFHVPKFLVPPLSDVLIALWRGLATSPFALDSFWYHGAVTTAEVLLGFGIGSVIGLALGVVISQSRLFEAVARPYIAAFQSIPKVAIVPIVIMWLGYGISSKVAVVCMLTFFPVLVTSVAGFKAVDVDRVDLLRSMSATQWQIFRKAKLPSALPYIFAGLDMAAAFSVVGAIVGEFVGAQAGLGVLILQSDAQMDTGGSFAVLVILSLIGIALTKVLTLVRRRVLHWMPAESTDPKIST